VVARQDATTCLRDGQTATVDGSRRIAEVHPQRPVYIMTEASLPMVVALVHGGVDAARAPRTRPRSQTPGQCGIVRTG
jgi:hypothetical protein